MKVMIVDDEQHVIDAIRILAQWETLGFQGIMTSNNSVQALALIEEHKPDLVLTDMMMPELHGMELVEKIREKNEKIQIIVISGYSDFNYIQHTIRQGGLDYITKPIDPDQLNAAVEKAVTVIQELKEIDTDKKNLWKLNPLHWNQLFTQLLEGETIGDEEFNRLSDKYHVKSGDVVRFVVLKLIDFQDIMASTFNDDMTLIQFAVRNICQEVMETSDTEGFVYLTIEEEMKVKLIFWGKQSTINVCLRSMMKALKDVYGVVSCCGISDVVRFPKGLAKGYQEASHRIQVLNVLEHNLGIYQKEPTVDDQGISYRLNHDSLLRDIKAYHIKGITERIEHAFKPIKVMTYLNNGSVIGFINQLEHDLAYYTSQLNLKSSQKPKIQVETTYFNKMVIPEIEQAFTQHVKDIMERYHHDAKAEEDPMEQIRDYIESHYDENIKLSKLADDYHLSKEHISRKFKQQYDVTLIEYLTNRRMTVAKELLGNAEISIKDIAVLVGYEDVKYFSKVFRRKFKMTPTEYRNT